MSKAKRLFSISSPLTQKVFYNTNTTQSQLNKAWYKTKVKQNIADYRQCAIQYED